MTLQGWAQISTFFVLLLLLVVPLGRYLHRVMEGEPPLPRFLRPLEEWLYRLSGVDQKKRQTWQQYTRSLMVLSLVGLVVLYGMQRVQRLLPLNPQSFANVEPFLAFNTAASFVTNTNWQSYSGESTLSYFTQMVGLTTQNFVSGAAGIAVAFAFMRGLVRTEGPPGGKTLGNFWVDMTRTIVYILLPLSLLASLAMVSQGVIQNLSPYATLKTLEGTAQTLALGPVASQEAIKMLGTNGGGFFNANSAHPFENPSALVNLLQMLLIFAVPAALTHTYGLMTKDKKQGWAILGAMLFLSIAGVLVAYWAEAQGNAALSGSPVSQPLGNMEGKEVRFGVANSALFATVTTDASCGAVNAMHDSFTALGGMVPLVNIMLGEVVFGGVGAGLYGMLVFVILAVFLAGLMVGRTPEYLGKKIESDEMKLALVYVLIFPLIILVLTAWAMAAPYGISSLNNAGPHGLSEMLYAFTSAAGNNGSAFAGLNANTPFFNTSLSVAMLAGRFLMILPVMAIAGTMLTKRTVPAGLGTFPTNGWLFSGLLVAVIVIVGALTYFPALTLGPILEHFLARNGKVF